MGIVNNVLSAFQRKPRIEKNENTNSKALKNNMVPLGQDFFRNGNLKSKQSIDIDEKLEGNSLYTGYLHAALNLRKNAFSDFCEKEIVTESFSEKEKDKYHPYLRLIEESKTVSEYEFWQDAITDYDMNGEVFIFLLRRVVYSDEKDPITGKRIISHIGLPTSIRVLDANKVNVLRNGLGYVIGYEEWIDSGHKRTFLPEQIIHIINKSPFNKKLPFSIFDAAKYYQYTLNKSTEFTKAALLNNLNTPGIVATDQILNDSEYDNLVSRINGHEAGKVIIADGAGKLNFTPISQNIQALSEIFEVNRNVIFAVTGTSKTMLGIEESGTTRDTARVQYQKFMQKTILPITKMFVSAFNFDYRTNYPNLYQFSPIELSIKKSTDPAQQAEIYTTRKQLFDAVIEMTYSGYTADSANRFMNGEIEFNDLVLEEDEVEDLDKKFDKKLSDNEDSTKIENDEGPEEQGWVGIKTENVDVEKMLSHSLKDGLYKGELKYEKTNLPIKYNSHFTGIYGLTKTGLENLNKDSLIIPNKVKINNIDLFELDDCNVVVALIEKTDEINQLRNQLLKLDHYKQEFEDYKPHISICYIDKKVDGKVYIELFKTLINKELKTDGIEIDNPFEEVYFKDDLDDSEKKDENKCSCHEGTCKLHKSIDDIYKDNEVEEVDLYSHNCHHDSESLEDWIDNTILKNQKTENGITEYGKIISKKLKSIYKNILNDVRKIQLDAIKESKLNINAISIDDVRSSKTANEIKEKMTNICKKYIKQIVSIVSSERKNDDKKLGLEGNVNLLGDKETLSYIDRISEKCANSHIETLYNEILKSLVKQQKKIKKNGLNLSDEDIDMAVKKAFIRISRQKAQVFSEDVFIRGVGTGIYYTDVLLVKINGKMHEAYKILESSYSDPCPICQAVIGGAEIPLSEDFLGLEDYIEYEHNGKKIRYVNSFEPIEYGNIHVGCRCWYSLHLKEASQETMKKLDVESATKLLEENK